MSHPSGILEGMSWDVDGNLRCGNEKLYNCEMFPSRGSRATTDARARLHHWKVWGNDAHCPQCAKPARSAKRSGIIEQDDFGLDFGTPVIKASRKKAMREHS